MFIGVHPWFNLHTGCADGLHVALDGTRLGNPESIASLTAVTEKPSEWRIPALCRAAVNFVDIRQRQRQRNRTETGDRGGWPRQRAPGDLSRSTQSGTESLDLLFFRLRELIT